MWQNKGRCAMIAWADGRSAGIGSLKTVLCYNRGFSHFAQG
ncbi:MAG: hypothetical protein Q4A85_02725 [Kingella sp. (in: b-proteobacteria)]|nr:hypothetical protein [Kingella sp. (in: b-proteobacteria)]